MSFGELAGRSTELYEYLSISSRVGEPVCLCLFVCSVQCTTGVLANEVRHHLAICLSCVHLVCVQCGKCAPHRQNRCANGSTSTRTDPFHRTAIYQCAAQVSTDALCNCTLCIWSTGEHLRPISDCMSCIVVRPVALYPFVVTVVGSYWFVYYRSEVGNVTNGNKSSRCVHPGLAIAILEQCRHSHSHVWVSACVVHAVLYSVQRWPVESKHTTAQLIRQFHTCRFLITSAS